MLFCCWLFISDSRSIGKKYRYKNVTQDVQKERKSKLKKYGGICLIIHIKYCATMLFRCWKWILLFGYTADIRSRLLQVHSVMQRFLKAKICFLSISPNDNSPFTRNISLQLQYFESPIILFLLQVNSCSSYLWLILRIILPTEDKTLTRCLPETVWFCLNPRAPLTWHKPNLSQFTVWCTGSRRWCRLLLTYISEPGCTPKSLVWCLCQPWLFVLWPSS